MATSQRAEFGTCCGRDSGKENDEFLNLLPYAQQDGRFVTNVGAIRSEMAIAH